MTTPATAMAVEPECSQLFHGLHPRHHAARFGSLRGGTHSERRGTHLVGGGCRHKLRALRGPGESYSDVILRLATDGEPR